MAREYMCAFHSMRKETKRLSDAQFGQLMRALLEYSETGVEPTNLTALSDRVQSAFDIYAGQIDRDTEAYAKKCARNRENIEKRWKKSNTTEYDGIRPNTNVYESYQEKEEEEEKGEEKEKEEYTPSNEGDARAKKTRFVPPTVDEVFAYMQERGETDYTVAESFVDYYVNAKWRVGSSRTVMTDWKAAVRNWLRRERKGKPKVKEKQTESSFDADAFMLTSLKRVYGEAGA